MTSARVAAFTFCSAVLLGGCLFIDNPNATSATGTSAASSSASGTGGADSGTGSSSGTGGMGLPPLCTKYGGYGTVEVVVGHLVGALVADCRISPFFTSLTPARQQHLGDCLTKQVAVLMHCPGIKYDTDSNGGECRDMKASHKGLGVRADDFDALIEDVVATLTKDGVTKEDIAAMAPALLYLKDDIVTNSAPGPAKSICDAGAGDAGDGG
ncbi:MAG: group 1 truncated hemoglobin [Byssovorax sp.]